MTDKQKDLCRVWIARAEARSPNLPDSATAVFWFQDDAQVWADRFEPEDWKYTIELAEVR